MEAERRRVRENGPLRSVSLDWVYDCNSHSIQRINPVVFLFTTLELVDMHPFSVTTHT